MYSCLPADDVTSTNNSLLHEEELQFVRELVQSCPDLYLDEYVSALYEQFGVSVSIASVHRVLTTLGVTHKILYRISQKSSPYLEGQFLNSVAHINSKMFMWGDEMGTNRNEAMHRRRGRAPKGERAIDRGMMFNREHYSCLAFMNYTGIIGHYTVKGAMNGSRLLYYTEQDLLSKMNTFPSAERCVLILDNCAIHKTSSFIDVIRRAGILLLFIPPYSPWLNPIEPVFRSVKAWLRRHSMHHILEGHNMHTLLMMALASITPEICEAFIRDSGYI
jgi:transposase